MDYKLVAVFSDGSTREQGCATDADVVNHTVQFVRMGWGSPSEPHLVNLTILHHTNHNFIPTQ